MNGGKHTTSARLSMLASFRPRKRLSMLCVLPLHFQLPPTMNLRAGRRLLEQLRESRLLTELRGRTSAHLPSPFMTVGFLREAALPRARFAALPPALALTLVSCCAMLAEACTRVASTALTHSSDC